MVLIIPRFSTFRIPPFEHSLKILARIYRPSFGHENARFRENMRKTLVFNSIRTQRRRFQLVLDEIRLGGSFQILGLRRVRDQLVFMHRTKQSRRSFLKNGQGKYLWRQNKNICKHNLLCYSMHYTSKYNSHILYSVHSDSSTQDFLNWSTLNERKHSRYRRISFIVLFSPKTTTI